MEIKNDSKKISAKTREFTKKFDWNLVINEKKS